MRLLVFAVCLLPGAAALVAPAPSSDGYVWHLPKSVVPPPIPADNPMSTAKVELGRRLFYDADLSLDGTTSCGTCHEQRRAFTEGNATHPGVGGVPGRRNVMGLANAAYFDPLTWADTTQHQLETQLMVPVFGTKPVETGMAGKEDELIRRLGQDNCYHRMFAAAFPETKGRMDMLAVGRAIAAFERTLVSFDSPYDQFRRGDAIAISAAARRGAKLFADLGCAGCHAGSNFTDGKFHNIGLYNEDGAGAYPAADPGLRDITGLATDEGSMRTPTLRNVVLTGPYMHDGSVKDLGDAIHRHFSTQSPLRDSRLAHTRRPSDADIPDLTAFLQSLSDQEFIINPDFALPKTACGKPL